MVFKNDQVVIIVYPRLVIVARVLFTGGLLVEFLLLDGFHRLIR